jgi:hypothetical protein
MAKLRDIEYAQSGEQSQSTLNADASAAIAKAEGAEMQQETKYFIFRLVNSSKKGGTYIPNIDDVINPATGKVERIRLLSGIDTIWQKEQKDVSIDYVRQNSRSLAFPRGAKVLRIPDWDTTALDFARICRHNVKSVNNKQGSKFEFYEYDPAAAAKEVREKEVLQLKMAIKAEQLPMDQVRKLCSFVRIPFHDEIGEMKTEDGLKTDLMLYAKNNAKSFEKLIGDQASEVEIAFVIKKAVISNQIDIATYPGRAFWASSGSTICHMPNGIEPVKHLTELAKTNTEEGRKFAEELKILK